MADNDQRELLEMALQNESKELILLPVSLLEEITDNFSEHRLLGNGGFGSVYKGILRNGLVAVKKLSDKGSAYAVRSSFFQEINYMMASKHKNIIRFLGHGFDKIDDSQIIEQKMYICSEYMPNGSLLDYIKDESCTFQWSTRYRIIRGIVDGVHYLHNADTVIIHRDLKPANVVLDDNMVPKITDFGVSRHLDTDKSQAFTKVIICSRGYTAPELLYTGKYTPKSDMYSLGVIMMDILVGPEKREELTMDETIGGGDILDTIVETWKKELAEGQVLKQIQVCAELAVGCMDMDHKERRDKKEGNPFEKRQRRVEQGRPEASEVIDRLREVENTTWSALGQINAPSSTGAELLDVKPRVLCFSLGKSDHSYLRENSCLLQLRNDTNHSVGYWIVPQFPKLYRFVSSCCGVVQPRETHIVNIVLVQGRRPPMDTGEFSVLTVARSKENSNDFMSVIGDRQNALHSDRVVDLLKRIKALGEVHEAVLTAVIHPSRKPKVIRSHELESDIDSIDVHPTEPWILAYCRYKRKLSIWNYQTQEVKELLGIGKEIRKKKKEIGKEGSSRTKVRQICARFMTAGPGDDGAHSVIICDADGWVRTMTYGTGETKINTPLFRKFVLRNNLWELHDFRNGGSTINNDPFGFPQTKKNKPVGLPVTALLGVDVTQRRMVLPGTMYYTITSHDEEEELIPTKYLESADDPVTDIKLGTHSFAVSTKNGILKSWLFGQSRIIRTLLSDQYKPINEESIPKELAAPSDTSPLFGAFDYMHAPGYGESMMIATTNNGASIYGLHGKVRDILWKCSDDIVAVACHPTHPFIFAAALDRDNGTSTICFWNYDRLGKIYRIEQTFHGLKQLGFVGSQRIVVIYDQKKIEVLEIELKTIARQQGTDTHQPSTSNTSSSTVIVA